MSSENQSSYQDKSFIPLLLLSISIIVILAWQLSEISHNREMILAAKKQWEDIDAANTQKYLDAAAKARGFEQVLSNLAQDLTKLAEKDETAKKIVDHYGIQYHPQASPAPSSGAGSP